MFGLRLERTSAWGDRPAYTDLGAAVEDWTEGAGVDVAFEVSGSPAGLTAANARPARTRPTGS